MDEEERSALYELLRDCKQNRTRVRLVLRGVGLEGAATEIQSVGAAGVYVEGGFVLLSAIASVVYN